MDFQLSRISQEYTNEKAHYKIENTITNKYIGSIIDIENVDGFAQTEKVSNISIANESFLNKDGWKNREELFMALTDEYLEELKKDGLIRNESKKRVYIRAEDGIIKAEIEGDETNNFTLSEEVLSKICADSNFDFEIDMNKGETRVRYGDKSIVQHHISNNSFNEGRIWRKLTGANTRSPFIFPKSIVKLRVPEHP